MKKQNHFHRNVEEQLALGMSEVSPFIEHVRGAQMTELLDKNYQLPTGSAHTSTVDATRKIPVTSPTGSSNITAKNLPIIIVRNTHTIPFALPFVLFCPVARDENYQSIFNFTQTMPAGVVCTGISFIGNRTLRFSFLETATLATDTIDVYTDFAVSYLSILNMLEEDWFQAMGVKLTVGKGNFDLQFNSGALHWGRLTFGGMVDTDSNPPAMYNRTDQFKDNIINADITLTYNGRRYLVWLMAPSITNPGDKLVRMDFFVEDYESTVDFDGGVTCKS